MSVNSSGIWQQITAQVSSFYGSVGSYILFAALAILGFFILFKLKPSFNKKVLTIIFLIALPIILLLDLTGILGQITSAISDWYGANANSAAMLVLIIFLSFVGVSFLVAIISSLLAKKGKNKDKVSGKARILASVLVLILTPLTIYITVNSKSFWQSASHLYANISSFYGNPLLYVVCGLLVALALFLLLKVKPNTGFKILIGLFLLALPILLLLDMSGALGSLVAFIRNWYSQNDNSSTMRLLMAFNGLIILLLLGAVISASRGKSKKEGKNGKFLFLVTLFIISLVPLTIYVGTHFGFLSERKYYFISFFLLLYALVPFFMGFEGRKPQAREVVLIAVLAAITIGGRAVFFMLPYVDPLIAMVVICGVCFGVETGFLVGAMSLLVSGFFFGMGPWVPWQMFTYGLIGFMAGLYHKIGWLPKNKYALAAFGFFAAVFLFGGIMDIYATVSFTNEITLAKVLTLYITGIPVNTVRGVAAIIFLMLLSDPMIEKLERIKLKYGIVER